MTDENEKAVIPFTQDNDRTSSGSYEDFKDEEIEISSADFNEDAEIASWCTQETNVRFYNDPMTEDIRTDFGFLLTQEPQSDTLLSPNPVKYNNDDNKLLHYDSSSTPDDESDANDEIENAAGQSVSERRAKNVQRNQQRMKQLGIEYGFKQTSSRKQMKRCSLPIEEGNNTIAPHSMKRPRGMLKHLHTSMHNQHSNFNTPFTSPTEKMKYQFSINQKLIENTEQDQPALHNQKRVKGHEPSFRNNAAAFLQILYDKFPGRQHQIEQLYGILSATVECSGSAIPPPIFVIGASGTGRTSVTQSVIEALDLRINNLNQCPMHSNKQRKHEIMYNPATFVSNDSCKSKRSPMVPSYAPIETSPVTGSTTIIHAYVNCATSFDLSTSLSSDIDCFTKSIYNQLEQKLLMYYSRKYKKSPESMTSMELQRTGELSTNSGKDNLITKENSLKVDVSSREVDHDDDDDDNSNSKNQDNDDLERLEKWESQIEVKQTGKKKSKNLAKTGHAVGASIRAKSIAESATNSNRTPNKSLTTVWKFGRSLARLFELFKNSTGQRVSVIIVLDNAERLLSQASKKSIPHLGGSSAGISYLTQLLLLPETIGLQLSMVVITKSILLEHTGLNTLCSKGTVGGHLHPIRIHFPVYRGRSLFKMILSTYRVQRLVRGSGFLLPSCNWKSHATAFQDLAYGSFTDTIVQSLQDYTNDIKQYIRFGRVLWPKYVEPVNSNNIEVTLRAAMRKTLDVSSTSGQENIEVDLQSSTIRNLQRGIIEALDRRIHPILRNCIEFGLFVLALDSPSIMSKLDEAVHTKLSLSDKGRNSEQALINLQYLCRYLLLAAYICQVNRVDKDRRLFSIQKNGRTRTKKGTNADVDNNHFVLDKNHGRLNSEESHLDDHTQMHFASLRPRVFPLERLLSVYVSMVGLHSPDQLCNEIVSLSSKHRCFNDRNIEEGKMLNSLGTIRFFQVLGYLRDIGLLCEIQSNTELRMSQISYWCSLTHDEAQKIARTVNVPLDRYILN